MVPGCCSACQDSLQSASTEGSDNGKPNSASRGSASSPGRSLSSSGHLETRCCPGTTSLTAHLPSVSGLLIDDDESRHSCTISKSEDVISTRFGLTVVCEQGEEHWTEHTARGGLPVFSVMVHEVFVLTRTDCGLSDRKSKIQLQKWEFWQRRESLSVTCC